MLSLEDCIGLCGLTEEEVLAIAHHEHLTEIAAAEMANYLTQAPDGELRIKRIILDDIDEAREAGNRDRAIALKMVLRDFIRRHPCCEARHLAALHPPPERRARGSTS